jgi:hypothetical protein
VINNFVSGLILLAERRIKVGDLVVVGNDEGYVRKISVRSTEVETYERSRILIPNSYLITEKVKNWTLRDNLRRIEIPVSVARGSDPRKVTVVLLKVAQDSPSRRAPLRWNTRRQNSTAQACGAYPSCPGRAREFAASVTPRFGHLSHERSRPRWR